MSRAVVPSAVGTAGAVVSCSVMMFAVFPALAGVVGASASAAARGLGSSQPGWIRFVSGYSSEMVLVSVGLLLWGIWRASRLVKILVGIGMGFLLVGQVVMVNGFVVPALATIIGGNVIGWVQGARAKRVAVPALET
ncbi:MAG: hypothetical protein M0Z54_06720 [Thermaerobacter sp.]|nr:hypothetical protein [Thermaerobacter sp.]